MNCIIYKNNLLFKKTFPVNVKCVKLSPGDTFQTLKTYFDPLVYELESMAHRPFNGS